MFRCHVRAVKNYQPKGLQDDEVLETTWAVMVIWTADNVRASDSALLTRRRELSASEHAVMMLLLYGGIEVEGVGISRGLLAIKGHWPVLEQFEDPL